MLLQDGLVPGAPAPLRVRPPHRRRLPGIVAHLDLDGSKVGRLVLRSGKMSRFIFSSRSIRRDGIVLKARTTVAVAVGLGRGDNFLQ